ncbi:choice-of-anchor I family protein [Corynebacterium qintianiae]|uniref:choice-of-anchor I family protein n=1 Tax=Corynebacterium qintianiae TaxID=2709392 RepID=UPI002016EF23|nr:choice-of-anchor I family protein [Corynebacterium qintianiae]
MVTITTDGKYALVANEGEPAEDYTVDPEGSVSVIALGGELKASAQADVRTADFTRFNAEGVLPEGVHVFGQVGGSTTVAQNLEPEYITVSGGKAYVSLQENNAIAVIDIASANVDDIFPIGYQDRTTVAFDSSDKDGGINFRTWPIKGILQPDAVASYSTGGQTFIVTANEGDARDWKAYSGEERLKNFGDDGVAPVCEDFGGLNTDAIAFMLSDGGAGRLNVTTAFGLDKERTCYEDLYAFGGRSFSIFSADGTRVFDSADDFERITARVNPEYFNSNHNKAEFDSRSDDKGPEPEGLALGTINGRTYAFIGFERVGGVIVYDITDPNNATYQTYLNNRDFLSNTGDLGPEGLTFIPAADSPNGENLLVVGNEVSGTTTVFQVDSLINPPADGGSTGSTGSADSSTGGSSQGIIGFVLGILASLLAAFGAIAGAVNMGIIPNPLNGFEAIMTKLRN